MKLKSADAVARFARENIYPEGSIEYVETFYVLLLDRSNQIFAWKQMSVGGVSYTVDVKCKGKLIKYFTKDKILTLIVNQNLTNFFIRNPLLVIRFIK